MPGDITLTAEGLRVRAQLAAAGIELTPAQLTAALVEATEYLLRENLSGFVMPLDWIEAVEASIYARAVGFPTT